MERIPFQFQSKQLAAAVAQLLESRFQIVQTLEAFGLLNGSASWPASGRSSTETRVFSRRELFASRPRF